MRIGILFSNYMYSYIELFLDLCEKDGIEVDFFHFSQDKVPFVSKIKNKYVINSKWKAKKFSTNKDIENEIKQLVNIDDYDYFLSDTMGLSFKNACNFFHGHTTNYKIEHISKGILRKFFKIGHQKLIKQESQYYKNTKFCFVGSKEMKKDYIENCNISPEKIIILHPGKDNIIEADVQRKDNGNIFLIGAVTCGFQLKGGYNILAAIRKLKKEFSPEQIKFRLINPNYKKQWLLKLYLKIFRIGEYIEFIPFQNNINNFYSSIDCLICASNAEAFGRVVTEAMIFGIPVIVGSNVGAAEILEDGKNGYVYEYGEKSAEKLADAVKRAYKSRNANEELIRNAQKTANEISWEDFSNKLFCTLKRSENVS